VRLTNVDAPEKGQPGFIKATETLRMIIEGGEVRIKTVSRDEYARAVSRVHQGPESISKKMKKQIK